MSGGLFDPLGTDGADRPRGGSRPPASVVAAGLLLAGLAALLALSWFRDDGDRGRPVAVVPIEHVQAPAKPPAAPPAPAVPVAPPPAAPAAALQAPVAASGLPPVRDGEEVEVQNGVRIIRPRRVGPAPGSQTIRVPAETPQR